MRLIGARVFGALCGSAIIGLVTQASLASVVVTDLGNCVNRGGWVGTQPHTGTVGFEFTPSVNMTVTALGYYDYKNGSSSDVGDGLLDSPQVGLWAKATGAELTRVTIPSGTSATLDGVFRYLTLATPISLTAGTAYVVGAEVQSGATHDVFADSVLTTTYAADVSGLGARWSSDYPLGNPTNVNGTMTGYFGPNIEYSVVPEPAAITLLLSPVVGLLRRRRSQSRFSA